MFRKYSIQMPILAIFLCISASVTAATFEVDQVAGRLEYHVYTGPDFVSEHCSFSHMELIPPPIEYTNVIMQEFFECTNPWLARMDNTGIVYQAGWPQIDATAIRYAQYQASLNSHFEVFEATLMTATSSISGEPEMGSYHVLRVFDLSSGETTTREMQPGQESISLILEAGLYEMGLSVDMMGESSDGVTISPYSAEIVVVLGEPDTIGETTRNWGHVKAFFR